MRYIFRLRNMFKLWRGLRHTVDHFFRSIPDKDHPGIQSQAYFQKRSGKVTVEYPFTPLPIPENSRYRLHNETADCIACDKCARICPVDCITIESFKAAEDLGFTSDGTRKRLHLPTFDIDMAKCCYCGLCTTVCPTECLTMTRVYDFSEFDRDNFVYHFGSLNPEQEETERQKLRELERRRAAAKSNEEGAA